MISKHAVGRGESSSPKKRKERKKIDNWSRVECAIAMRCKRPRRSLPGKFIPAMRSQARFLTTKFYVSLLDFCFCRLFLSVPLPPNFSDCSFSRCFSDNRVSQSFPKTISKKRSEAAIKRWSGEVVVMISEWMTRCCRTLLRPFRERKRDVRKVKKDIKWKKKKVEVKREA